MGRKINKEEDTNYWISFSDLMAGMLIIFILLFIFRMLDYSQSSEKLNETQRELEETKKIVLELSGTRAKIIALLQEAFEKEKIDIAVDINTGSIMLREGVLFDVAKSQMKDEGKEFLERFIPVYLRILLENEEINQELAEIIIEGHTDDVGSYIYNLGLSQDRAFNVATFILSDEFEYNHKEKLKKYLTANGKSFSNPIYKDNEIDRESSRRVVLKFRLKEEETLLEINKQLEAGGRNNE
ncbi:chemotaxis protein MotB [Acetoanaerobium pronyense]|uniref:Chemotaxis protein MotB n=1 Tax=Acetoanaerobium pronyense TaxID=1482736 RepID=A0ABS4KLV1_9FIRM|nr:OmpA family protein [Acetoanaerobium pronyense]MBP2028765.1 chemotaxis protein MotB [Acetoanaerobium pronyense]